MPIFFVNGEKNHSRQKLHFPKHGGPVLSLWCWTSAINQDRGYSLGTGMHLSCYFSIVVQSLWNSFEKEGKFCSRGLQLGLWKNFPTISQTLNMVIIVIIPCMLCINIQWLSLKHPEYSTNTSAFTVNSILPKKAGGGVIIPASPSGQ